MKVEKKVIWASALKRGQEPKTPSDRTNRGLNLTLVDNLGIRV